MSDLRPDPDTPSELRDEFWGEQTEWTPQRRPSATRRGLGATVRGWWDGILGGSTDAERSHRLPDAGLPDDVSHSEVRGDRALDVEDEAWVVEVRPYPPQRPAIDPLLARLGGLAVILTLAAPLVVGFTGSGSDGAESAGSLRSASSGMSVAEAASPSVASTEGQAAAASGSSTTETTLAVDATSSPSPERADDVVAAVPAPAPVAAVLEVSTSDAATTSVTVATCGNRYELAAGDYWIRIADAAGVPLADLLAVNDSTVDTMLVPGRSICLPAGAITPAPPPTAPTATAPTTTAPTTTAPTASSAATTAARAPRTNVTATTVAPVPTTTAPARPPAVATSDAVAIIREIWPDELEERALEIAWRESNHRSNVNNWCCYGLFQIHWQAHQSWLASLGVTSVSQLYDPVINATAAYTLYQRAGGFGPWGG